jgi:hypothetical protein
VGYVVDTYFEADGFGADLSHGYSLANPEAGWGTHPTGALRSASRFFTQGSAVKAMYAEFCPPEAGSAPNDFEP